MMSLHKFCIINSLCLVLYRNTELNSPWFVLLQNKIMEKDCAILTEVFFLKLLLRKKSQTMKKIILT